MEGAHLINALWPIASAATAIKPAAAVAAIAAISAIASVAAIAIPIALVAVLSLSSFRTFPAIVPLYALEPVGSLDTFWASRPHSALVFVSFRPFGSLTARRAHNAFFIVSFSALRGLGLIDVKVDLHVPERRARAAERAW